MVTDTSNEEMAANGSATTEGQASGSAEQGGPALTKEAELEAKLLESEKKYLYLYSEFETFRRRIERERSDLLKFGHESFLRDLLQVVDNFERALAHAKSLNPEKGSPLALVNQGVEMIHYQMMEALKAQGTSPVLSKGAKFDPAFHEAVAEEESDQEPGTVLREDQRGFLLHGRLLRPARVVIAKKKD